MKDLTLLALSGILAAGAAPATTLFLRADPPSTEAADAAASPAEAPWNLQLEALEQKQLELEQYLDSLAQAPATAPNGAAKEQAVTAAVERWLEENAQDLAAVNSTQELAPGLEEDPALEAIRNADIDELIDMITNGALSAEETQYAWQRLADADRLDDVVAGLERMVELDPQDPDLRVTLGNSYLQQLFHGASGPLSGILAGKADAAFDAAIQLDESHLDARFMKAVSLSNWPAFLGKQGEAIEQFEELIVLQESQTLSESYSQSYLFLGNMYLETGDAAKALATWKRGLEIYPMSDALRDQIQRNGGR